MESDFFDGFVCGVAAGFTGCLVLWALSGRRRNTRDLVRERVFFFAQEKGGDLPEPDDAQVREMMVDARIAPTSRAPYVGYVLALGAALLKCRRRDDDKPADPPNPRPN